MSSLAGELLVNVVMQYVVPVLLREATGLGDRPVRVASSRPNAATPPPARLRLVPPTSSSIISQTPGRVRIRVGGLRGDAGRETAVLAALRDLAGVRFAQASRLTGNVLVEYDPGQIRVADVVAALDRVSTRVAGEAGSVGNVAKERQLRLALVGA